MAASTVRLFSPVFKSSCLFGGFFRTVQRNVSSFHHPYRCYHLSNFTSRQWFSSSLFRTSEFDVGVNGFDISNSRYEQLYTSHKRSFSSHQDVISSSSSKEGNEDTKETEAEKAKREEEERRKKVEFSKQATKYTLIGMGVMISSAIGYLLAIWGAPPRDEEGNILRDEFSDFSILKAYFLRARNELIYYNKLIQEPSREKLLPDPLQEPYFQPPYTLVIEMTGILVHPDWTYKTGWRFKKRPGVDFLLHQAGPPLFEIVVYTFEQGFTAFPIIDSLDPDGCVMYRLFRDATRYLKGHHVKDLSCLNRDLSRVIFVDWNEKSFQLQPENAFKLKKWTGNDDDTKLFDLAMFLRTIAASEVEDVRPVLDYYKQFDEPLEVFKVNQKRLQEEQDRLNKQRMEILEKPAGLTGSSFLGGFFGGRH